MNAPKDYTIVMDQSKKEYPVCPICMSSDSPAITFSCSHSCCEECWTQIISAANSEFNVNKIKCFHLSCKKPIENIPEIIECIKDKDIVSRFKYLVKKQQIINEKDKFLCPNKSCGMIIDSGNQEATRLKYNLDHEVAHEDAEFKPIDDLDYSFLVCDHCSNVFCKVCEVYHDTENPVCLRRKNSNSENILKVKKKSF